MPAAPFALPRLPFITPDRAGLPALGRYASLRLPTGERRVAGYTEATRGCKHRCRHCPIVPVYDGQFRVVQADAVLGDIRAQVAAGAEHITFGDPDFLNGPTHARRIVEALAREWPGLTYDVVIKIEHILRHEDVMHVLRDTGCLFVTSAVESVDDAVLARLEKGHTRADFERAAARLRAIGLTLVPTFVAFTPWTTIATYLEMLDALEELELVEHVSPVQLAIRLLIPNGSRLLELDDIRSRSARFDPAAARLRVATSRSAGGCAAARSDGARGPPAGRHRARRSFAPFMHSPGSARASPHEPCRQSARASPERRCRIWTSPGTVERSLPKGSWLFSDRQQAAGCRLQARRPQARNCLQPAVCSL